MQRFVGLILALTIGNALAVTASGQARQSKIIVQPDIGTARSASAGDVIWSANFFPSVVVHGKKLSGDAQGGALFSGSITVPSGIVLSDVEGKHGVRACAQEWQPGYNISGQPCLIDTDGDGAFDSFSAGVNGRVGKLKGSVAYTQGDFEQAASLPTFRQLVTYSGANGANLQLSYREFNGVVARPAFTEALSIPLTASFPQNVRFKGVLMKVEKLDGEGVTYVILDAPRVAPSQR